MFKKIARFFKKFNTLLIILLATAICAGTITAGAIYIRSMVSSLWKQIVSDVTEITAQGAHSFEIFLQKEIDSIDTLKSNLEFFNYNDQADREKALELFDMYSEEDGYFIMAVFDQPEASQNCTVYLAISNESIAQAGDEKPERTVTITPISEFADCGESGISNTYYNMYTGQKSISYYSRFEFKDGTRALVRKGQVLTDINKKFALSFYEDTGFSYVTKNDGEIILRSDNINSNRTSKNIFNFFGEGEESDREMQLLKNVMAEGKAGAMLSTANDDDKVLSFIPIKHTDNWYMVSVIPNEAVSANVESIIQSSLALAVIIIAVVVLFSLFGLLMYFFRRKMSAKEAEVRYREQLFGILANNTDDVFIMMEHGEDVAEYISPNIHRVLGVEEAEVRQNLHAIGKPKNENENQKYGGLDAVKEIGVGMSISFNSERAHRETGEIRYFHETAYHVSIDGNEKDIIVFSDRTADKLAETALKEAVEAAKSASNAKTNFLSSMSHDIRTPMNAIVGMTSIALKHMDDKERVKDCLNKITMSSTHLLTLINDVLDISKIESGKFNLSPVVFSLRETVTNLVNIVRPQITEKALQFEIHVRGVTHEYLYADVLRVNQIFINILSNAVKYTPEGGKITLDLIEQVTEEDKAVRITYIVKDTGIGMSEEYMKTMYETFSRAKDSRINTVQGTGLGLAIVKQMVTLMNGTIDCESEINKGTKFTIVLDLPVGKVEQSDMRLPPIKVLAVDDDELFLDNVRDMMGELGATVETASSGESALELIKHHGGEYAVVIVDWKMPKMSGLETIKEVRKLINKTPIILVSAYDWEDIENEAKSSGVDGFISKPLFRSYIYEKLCALLNLHESEEKTSSGESNDLNGLNILVAEDNDLNWEVVSVLLSTYGMTCSRAENGKRCVEKMECAADGEYSLILMDVQMPVMNGKEATRAIRQSDREYVRNIPILAMTADAFAEDIAACLEAGMNGHLSKPIDMDKLIQQIRSIVFGNK